MAISLCRNDQVEEGWLMGEGAFSLNQSQKKKRSAPMTLTQGVFGVAYIFIYEFEVFGLSHKEAK